MKLKIGNLFGRLPFGTALKLTILILAKKWGLNDANFFFSQTGEDILLKFLVEEKTNGTYVDVGCNQPIALSNTFYFYLVGWNGICIDANEVLCKKFKNIRPKDTVITAALSDEEKEVTFFVSDSVPAVSTIDQSQLEEWKSRWEFNREVKMKTQRLEEILNKHLQKNTVIDFMTIDVEGHDFNVLKSLNLSKYRPKWIVIEMHNFNLGSEKGNEVHELLAANDYRLCHFALMNGYFKDSRQ